MVCVADGNDDVDDGGGVGGDGSDVGHVADVLRDNDDISGRPCWQRILHFLTQALSPLSMID